MKRKKKMLKLKNCNSGVSESYNVHLISQSDEKQPPEFIREVTESVLT